MKTHVNDRLHAPVALTLRQKFPIFYGLRVGLAPKPVWRCEERKISVPRQELNPNTKVIKQVA